MERKDLEIPDFFKTRVIGCPPLPGRVTGLLLRIEVQFFAKLNVATKENA
jgi:hypothetical protein